MNRSRAIAIVGTGLVTPLGGSGWATIRALLDGRRTADRVCELSSDLSATEISRAAAGCTGSGFSHSDPSVVLAERAAREAMDEAASLCPAALEHPLRTIVASSKGAVIGMLTREAARLRPTHVALGPHGFLSHELRHRLTLGHTTAIVAACATGLYAIDQAVRELQEGRFSSVLVLGVEAALHELFVESYRRLGILAPHRPASVHVASPLDEGRSGFTLNECAAAVILSTLPLSRTPRGYVLESAVGTEPHDLVRLPDRFRTLERLATTILDGRPLALIQPHATGTVQNDEKEVECLARVLGRGASDCGIYASKGAIGHGMGASGVVNVVLSCLMGRVGKIPPMPWVKSPIRTPFRIRTGGAELSPGLHGIFAAGFGGHAGGVLLEVP